MITNKNEAIAMNTSCDYKCKCNSTTCNSNQKWNNKICQWNVKIIVHAKIIIVGSLANVFVRMEYI